MHFEEDNHPMADITDGERHVIAASYHLLKALQSTESLTKDTRKLLGDLDVHLSSIIKLSDDEAEDYEEIDAQLVSAQHTIMNLHSNHSRIWASSPVIALEYLQAVSDVQSLISNLENMFLKGSSRAKELLDQARSILQMAMDRLQIELIHILVQHKLSFEREDASLPGCKEILIFDESSIILNEDDSVENASLRDGGSAEAEDYAVDFIHPDVVPQIKSIADIMHTSGYGEEFCQVFTGFWRDTLVECLTILDVENFSIEDVLQMEWKILNSRIRKWRVAVKSIIGIYLASAKRLFDQVLGESGHSSFIEVSKGPVSSLLNFGQAVAIGPHRPEWLFCLLDMYEVLTALVQDVDALFTHSVVRSEFHELLTRLGGTAKSILKELGNNIESCSTTTPFVNGGIHPLTKYVVNYILCFAEYGPTLDFLLQDQEKESPNEGQIGESPSSPVATYLQSLISTLEANLENKSSLYKDAPLKHLFMTNNIHYMVRKIMKSKISHYFGGQWIRNNVVKFRQHALQYERLTWNSILALLRDDGKTGKTAMKTRSRAFITAFEELYKNQTKWLVPDLQLREEMRISASKIVIQAYRNFVNKISHTIGEKHIKYSEQELGTYILDLLEGSAKTLKDTRKR